MEQALRFAHAEAVAENYLNYVDFAVDGMSFLGFPTNQDASRHCRVHAVWCSITHGDGPARGG